jgi:LmbE family N-acetylglucosaminyl deacetylase
MFNSKKTLIVAAHPDDEILGCGGTAKLLAKNGTDVKVIILGEGAQSRYGTVPEAEIDKTLSDLKTQAKQAGHTAGINEVIFGGLPDNRFDTVALLDIIKILEQVKRDFKPDTVFTQHGGDLNNDHFITNKATLTAFRPLPDENCIRLYAYEVQSSTEFANPTFHENAFRPNVFVDIADSMQTKLDAFAFYKSEIQPDPYPRSMESIKILAQIRGRQCGKEYAEAFMLMRKIY